MNSMKLLHNVPAITKAVILAGLMSACQNEKDAVVSPGNSLEQVTDANARTPVKSPVKYLIKDDGTKLTYSGINNQLTKESYTSPIGHLSGFVKEYTYTGNKITCDLKKNGVIITKNYATYTLNAKGLCVESVLTPDVDIKIGGTYIYVYNELNQLTTVYHKNLPKLRQVFEYEEDADYDQASLSKITFYDQYDKIEKEILFQYANGKYVVNYKLGGGSVYLTELENNPLNPTGLAESTSKYLPIFGKFSRYILKQTVHKNFVQLIYPYPTFVYNSYSTSPPTDEITTKVFETQDGLGKVLSKVERKYSTNPQPVMTAQ